MDAYDSFILLLTGVGFCFVLSLNSVTLETEALSDFAVMEMHKKRSCLIILHARLLFWVLDCISCHTSVCLLPTAFRGRERIT